MWEHHPLHEWPPFISVKENTIQYIGIMGSNQNGISKVWWVAETWLHLAMCKSPQDVEMCVKLHIDPHQKKTLQNMRQIQNQVNIHEIKFIFTQYSIWVQDGLRFFSQRCLLILPLDFPTQIFFHWVPRPISKCTMAHPERKKQDLRLTSHGCGFLRFNLFARYLQIQLANGGVLFNNIYIYTHRFWLFECYYFLPLLAVLESNVSLHHEP